MNRWKTETMFLLAALGVCSSVAVAQVYNSVCSPIPGSSCSGVGTNPACTTQFAYCDRCDGTGTVNAYMCTSMEGSYCPLTGGPPYDCGYLMAGECNPPGQCQLMFGTGQWCTNENGCDPSGGGS